ncbi:hypothetical protein DSO57_1034993 [Entomophthora muscae]|uniref:Uncharacterized protein n=1 Tax=Entomophthora muscae TaxID=34485 RepID=A0ACC2S1L9_9FUNG|nr:hypothetical protein DSO57_1034993 [Entomophthora muscae]
MSSAFEAFCHWVWSLVLALVRASIGSLLLGFLSVWALWLLLSSLRKYIIGKTSSTFTALSGALVVNITLVSPCTPPTTEVCEKVLDALGKLQLRLAANLASIDAPISDAQRSVALLDALNEDTHLWVCTLLCQSQELGNTASLLTLVSFAVAAPGSKASVIFETLCSKGLAPDLATHMECFVVKAASLDLPAKVAVAMFPHSLDPALADKGVWEPTPPVKLCLPLRPPLQFLPNACEFLPNYV